MTRASRLNRFLLCPFSVLAIPITLLACNSALAQNASTGLVIEEVIVTAQKREQRLSDVGTAVTAFSADDIAEFGWSEPSDLAGQTPNMNVNQVLGNSIPNVSIRGIGLNDYAVNNNPAVGVYLDEVYLVSPAMLSFQLFDMERVEVLKGPQGTLYGRNTTAGAVNFVSKRPSNEVEGDLRVSYGSFERTEIQGGIGGPLGETVSGRVAFRVDRQSDGHQDNRFTGESVGEVDRVAWRGMLAFEPSESFKMLGTWYSGRDDSDTLLVKVDNTYTTEDDAFFPGDRFESGAGPNTYMNVESDGGTLRMNWDISDNIQLTSVTGMIDFSRKHLEDRDGTGLSQLDGTFLNEVEQFSQEVRLTAEMEDLVVIVGATLSEDEVETRDIFETNDFFTSGVFTFRAVGNEYRQETESNSAFVDAEWQMNPDWRLVAGVRYTDEEKDFFNAYTFIYVDALPANGGTEIGVFAPVAEEYSVGDLSGRLGLHYTGMENSLIYFNLSKGFKSGNFQGQLTFTPSDLSPFDEENVIAYEAGLKSYLFDGRIQIDASAFFYDYKDMQIYGPLFTEPIDPLFGIDNVGDAEIVGAEVAVRWPMNERLDLRLGVGLLDTEVTDSKLPVVEEGSELPNAPDVNFNFRLDYSQPVYASMDLKLSLYGNYKDEVSYDVVRAPQETIEDGYWLMNMRGGIASDNGAGRWEVYLWCENLFDETYRAQVLNSTVGWGETWGMPRTYGIGVSYSW